MEKKKEAEKTFREAIEADPENSYYLYELGKAFFKIEQPKKSIELFQRAIKLDPDEASLFEFLGDVYQSMKRIEEARKAYLKTTELDPENHKYQYKLAGIWIELEKYEKACKLLIKAIKTSPDPEYAISLITACRKMPDRQKAKRFLRQAMIYDPRNEEIKHELNNWDNPEPVAPIN